MTVLFVTEEYTIEPLGIGYLSACLKQAGHKVEMLAKPKGELLDWERWAVRLARNPDMVCFSVVTGKHQLYRDVNRIIKTLAPTVFTLAGGAHCTFYPQYVRDGFDAICRGEGFDAIVEVADAVQVGQEVGKIFNIVTADTVESPAPMRRIRNMDDAPWPDRGILYSNDRTQKNPFTQKNHFRSVLASGPCMMSCRYCYSPEYRKLIGQGEGAGNRPLRNPEQVALECASIAGEWPVSIFYFQDDIFPIYDRVWVDDFCAAYSGVGMPFHIQTRAEFIRRDAVVQLRQVGLHGVTFAVESGNPERRKMILNRSGSNEMYVQKSDILRSLGIRFRIENILGTPGETFDECLQTLDLNIQCAPDVAWASLFQPYPGTELGNECIANGTFDGNLDVLGGDFYHSYGMQSDRIRRLQSLFGLVVWKPYLRPLVSLLVRMKIDYHGLYQKVKAHLYKTRLYKTEAG